MTEAPEKSKTNILTRLAEVAAAIAAYFFVGTFGWIFLWPMIGTTAFVFVARRLVRPRFKAMIPAVALQGGQVIWLLAGIAIFVTGSASATEMSSVRGNYSFWQIGDIILYITFIVWVALRSSMLAVVSASLYQVLGIALAAFEFTKPNLTIEYEKAMAMHAFLNISIVVLLFVGLYKVRRETRGASHQIASQVTGY